MVFGCDAGDAPMDASDPSSLSHQLGSPFYWSLGGDCDFLLGLYFLYCSNKNRKRNKIVTLSTFCHLFQLRS
jgi:hypothetical protein